MDYDATALCIMLSDAPRSVREKALEELRQSADVDDGIRCPNCDEQEAIESNGRRGFCCTSCGTQWGE